jgi:hypothetical protein
MVLYLSAIEMEKGGERVGRKIESRKYYMKLVMKK